MAEKTLGTLPLNQCFRESSNVSFTGFPVSGRIQEKTKGSIFRKLVSVEQAMNN